MQVLPAERVTGLAQELGPPLRERGIPLLGALPYSGVLGSKRLDEVKSALNAVLLRRHSRVDVGVDKVMREKLYRAADANLFTDDAM